MIAPAKVPAWQPLFLDMLPTIERYARTVFATSTQKHEKKGSRR